MKVFVCTVNSGTSKPCGELTLLGGNVKKACPFPHHLLSTPFPLLDWAGGSDPVGNSDRYSAALRITIINLKLTWSNTEVHDEFKS